MAKEALVLGEFAPRRRKEYLAFLAVKFLKARSSFKVIHAEFQAAVDKQCLAQCGLHKKVREIEEGLVYDMKEMAHLLFRASSEGRKAARPRAGARDTRRMIAELKSGIETRSIDSFVGTGYHLLLILRESLYQLERYVPEYQLEQDQVGRIEQLARSIGYTFSSEEMSELEHLRDLSAISLKLSNETLEMTCRLMERCETLFERTALVVRHFIEGAGDNEILMLNLLQNIELLESVYGEESADRIFWILCRHKRVEGGTGVERAMNYVKLHCGNATGLPKSLAAPAEAVPAKEAAPARTARGAPPSLHPGGTPTAPGPASKEA